MRNPLVVLGLWIAGAGSIGFLLALALIGLLVARYATSRAGVGSVPSPTSGRGGSTVRTTARPPSTSGGGNTVTEGRFELGRALPVLRGWLTVAVLLVIGAAGSVSLWIVDGGPAGLLVGLALVGAVAAWYSVSGTW